MILSIGDELVAGTCVDTNAAWLCQLLTGLGVAVEEVRQVPDARDRIAHVLQEAAGVLDLVICTGGLGPTPDDLTREALADAFDDGNLLEDELVLTWLAERLDVLGVSMNAGQRRMAIRPAGASWFPNEAGTAPILRRDVEGCTLWCLPGPPVEMKWAFRTHVLPVLSERGDTQAVPVREVRCHGIVEAEAAERLGELLDRDADPLVGTRVSRGIFIASVHGAGPRVETTVAEIEDRLRPWAFGHEGDCLQDVLGRVLLERDEVVSTAESCTGGWISSSLVDVPGSSRWFAGGVVSYSNPMKTRWLDVPERLLAPGGPGAVSREVALAMASGIREATGSTWGLSVTGIAGPDGGIPGKPVGTVWIGCVGPVRSIARCFLFPGDRRGVRSRTVLTAMQCLRMELLDMDPGTALSWESAT